MINVLIEIIKIIHEKMLKAIHLYSFHNDTTSDKNNSLNDLSKQP